MSGVVKGLDAQGRLTVPKETLRAAGLEPGDMVQILCATDAQDKLVIILERYFPGCALCGTPVDDGMFREYYGKRVCEECVQMVTTEGEESQITGSEQLGPSRLQRIVFRCPECLERLRGVFATGIPEVFGCKKCSTRLQVRVSLGGRVSIKRTEA